MNAIAILGVAWMAAVVLGIWTIAIAMIVIIKRTRFVNTKSSVGELQVRVTADTSQFDEAIDRTIRKAKEASHLGAKETV